MLNFFSLSNYCRAARSIHSRFWYFWCWSLFFLLCEQFFSWFVVIIFLVGQSVFLFHTYLDFSSNCRQRFYCVLRPSKFLFVDFPTLFRAVISPFSNSDYLVPLAIYVFSILSITVLIAFILRRLYMINVSIKLNPFYFSFYWWSYICAKNEFKNLA